MSEFRTQLGLRAVISGVGSVESGLTAELESQGVTRPMIVCGANLAASPVMAVVRQALRKTPVVFSGSRPHTPVETVNDGAAAGRDGRVDGLIAVGGSSAIDCAKGIAVLLATGRSQVADLTPAAFGHLSDPFDAPGAAPFPLLMVTTTLSFAEFLPFWGVRQRQPARKLGYPDYGRVMRTAFLDGLIASHTPDPVWFETGVKALDDALFTFCRSAEPEAFIDPMLVNAIRDLVEWLPASGGAESVHARQRVLTSTWMTKFPLPRLGPPAISGWFSTAARHALGGVFEVPHGAASCVALPEGLRFHVPTTWSRQAALAEVLGWEHDDDETVAPLGPGLAKLLISLGVPTSLRQCGIDASGLAALAEHMVAESPQLGTPAEIVAACARML